MTLDVLESQRVAYKDKLEHNIEMGKTLLSNNGKHVDHTVFLNHLSTCIRNLNLNVNKLEETHESLSLATEKYNEEQILSQIEKDFECLDSAYDIRIKLECIEKVTLSTIQNQKGLV